MKYVPFILLLAAASSLVLPARSQTRRLSGSLPRPGAADLLDDFALSADGTRLVFRGDVLEDEVFELYSVPIAGGAALELSGSLAASGDVVDVLLTPDGASAVFLADGLVDGRPEFFRVPLDGSAAPLALDPSPNEDEVTLTRMAPDGARILFTRREVVMPNPFQQIHVERLFVLALDGSQSKVLIAEAHPPHQPTEYHGSSFVDVEFSPDGQRALYTDQISGKAWSKGGRWRRTGARHPTSRCG